MTAQIRLLNQCCFNSFVLDRAGKQDGASKKRKAGDPEGEACVLSSGFRIPRKVNRKEGSRKQMEEPASGAAVGAVGDRCLCGHHARKQCFLGGRKPMKVYCKRNGFFVRGTGGVPGNSVP